MGVAVYLMRAQVDDVCYGDNKSNDCDSGRDGGDGDNSDNEKKIRGNDTDGVSRVKY